MIIRTHPVLRWRDIKKSFPNINHITNIKVSENNNIYSDLANAQFCVYWGSAVCLDAISSGIPVAHYNEGKYLSYDPLFQLNAFKWNIKSDNDLDKIINNINKMPINEYNSLRQQAQKYICDYLHENNDHNMYKFIK